MYADFRIPGIEGISGSLGHGVGMGAGFALQLRGKMAPIIDLRCPRRWRMLRGFHLGSSAMFAAHHQLDNLVVIVDRNDHI